MWHERQMPSDLTSSFEELLARRKSVRAFRTDEVPENTLRAIFAEAQRAPSWCNTQPWHVWVVRGKKKHALIADMVHASQKEMPQPEIVWPVEYPDPYGERRRACGKALYDAMAIARDDKAGRAYAWQRNFEAFDAPHVAFVAVPKVLGSYGMLDLGIWLGTLLLSATEAGVATCAQASLATFPSVVRKHLAIGEHLALAVGVGLGFEDDTADANRCRTDRVALQHSVEFVES